MNKHQSPATKYRMLVLDLDDTLLNDHHQISPRNKEALLRAQESGVKVVLASGRPTAAMLKYAFELELDRFGSFIISFNGGNIIDMQQQKTIFEQSLSPAEIHSLHDFSLENNLHIITYSHEGVISETHSEYIDVELNLTGMPHCKVDCFKTKVDFNAVKCILLEEPAYLKLVEQKLKPERSDLSIAISKPFFLEVMPKGIDKAASIQHLAEQLNIAREEIIAVGNAGNDLSMVQFAGLGVWVDNVSDELRHYADTIVASNNNDGVAEVVERYIFVVE